MQFFESGYNGSAWILEKTSEDIFYFEMNPCSKSDSLVEEIEKAFDQMRSEFSNWKFINDQSLPTQTLGTYLKPSEIIDASEVPHFDRNFWKFLNKNYGIIHAKDLAFLTISKNLNQPVVWPTSSGRIYNMNYRRSLKKTLGIPYWVYNEPERFHKIRMAVRELKLNIYPDFLKLTPQLMRSYFLHPLHLSMYSDEKFSLPHNDDVERRIFSSLNKGITDLYPNAWEPDYKLDLELKLEQTAKFPIHILLKKYFAFSNEFQPYIQDWYGKTC